MSKSNTCGPTNRGPATQPRNVKHSKRGRKVSSSTELAETGWLRHPNTIGSTALQTSLLRIHNELCTPLEERKSKTSCNELSIISYQ
eukprot:4795647-Pyramimonas_sp.AAC.1